MSEFTPRRGDIGIVSFSKLVAAVSVPTLSAAAMLGIWIDLKIERLRHDQDKQNADVYVTRREYADSKALADERYRELRDAQRSNDEVLRRIDARLTAAASPAKR